MPGDQEIVDLEALERRTGSRRVLAGGPVADSDECRVLADVMLRHRALGGSPDDAMGAEPPGS